MAVRLCLVQSARAADRTEATSSHHRSFCSQGPYLHLHGGTNCSPSPCLEGYQPASCHAEPNSTQIICDQRFHHHRGDSTSSQNPCTIQSCTFGSRSRLFFGRTDTNDATTRAQGTDSNSSSISCQIRWSCQRDRSQVSIKQHGEKRKRIQLLIVSVRQRNGGRRVQSLKITAQSNGNRRCCPCATPRNEL